MFYFIVLTFILIFIISIMSNNNTATKPNKNILLGVSLPFAELTNKDILNIVIEYKLAYKKLSLLAFILGLPGMFMSYYLSITIVYFTVWVAAYYYFNERLYLKYFKRLLTYKKENNLFFGAKQVLKIDLEVSRLKNTMVISKLWFIPSFIISLIPIIIYFSNYKTSDKTIFILFIPHLISLILFFYLYIYFTKSRTKVYSKNTEINIACNTVSRRYWSILFITLCIVHSLLFLALAFAFMSNSFENVALMVIIISVPFFALLATMYTYNLVRDTQNNLLQNSHDTIYTDSDEYWEKGYYYNPYDSKVTVEKRVGYGSCYNMATKKGKFMTYFSNIFALVVILGITIPTFLWDFGKINVIKNENIISIKAPLYNYEFNTADIESISLVDNLPSGGLKTNGVGTAMYSIGNFNINGYGPSKMYIYRNKPPYIIVKLKSNYLFINGQTSQETNVYYELLNNN